MKVRSHLLASLVVALSIISMPAVAQEDNFPDVPANHWAFDSAKTHLLDFKPQTSQLAPKTADRHHSKELVTVGATILGLVAGILYWRANQRKSQVQP